MKKILAVSILLAACSTVKKVNELPEIPVEANKEAAPIGAYKTASTLSWMKDLERVANCVKVKDSLYQEIEATEFTRTNGKTSKQIASELRAGSFNLGTYSKWRPYKSLELATYNTKTFTVLYRTQANPRSMPEMVETAFHESMHLLGFFHDGNYATEENLKTVPYKVGAIARKHIGECK